MCFNESFNLGGRCVPCPYLYLLLTAALLAASTVDEILKEGDAPCFSKILNDKLCRNAKTSPLTYHHDGDKCSTTRLGSKGKSYIFFSVTDSVTLFPFLAIRVLSFLNLLTFAAFNL